MNKTLTPSGQSDYGVYFLQKVKGLFIVIFLFIVVRSPSQDLSHRFLLDVGLTARTPVFYYKGLDGQTHGPLLNGDAPYSYKTGVVGMDGYWATGTFFQKNLV